MLQFLRRIFTTERRPEEPRAEPSLSEKRVAHALIGDWQWPISDALALQIQRELPAKLGQQPTMSQWAMILAKNPNVAVVAGAGSGKSTTLVQRALVMHHYLGVPLDALTIFSFTRKSTAEFRNKLRAAFAEYDITLDDKTLRRVVRTFHSKLHDCVGQDEAVRMFEHLDGDPDPDKGLFERELSLPSKAFLGSAYDMLFGEDAAFRESLLRTYKSFLKKRSSRMANYREDEVRPYVLQSAAAGDRRLIADLVGYFSAPPGSVGPADLEVRVFGTTLIFRADHFIAALGIWVVHAPDKATLGTAAQTRRGKVPLGLEVETKKRIG